MTNITSMALTFMIPILKFRKLIVFVFFDCPIITQDFNCPIIPPVDYTMYVMVNL